MVSTSILLYRLLAILLVTAAAAVPEAPGALQSSVTQTKRELIIAAWRKAGGDHNRTAVALNLHPNSLRRLIRNLGLREMLGDHA